MRRDTERLYGVDGSYLRHISMDDHNRRIASGQCIPFYDERGRYRGIKIQQSVHEETKFGTVSGIESPTSLTMGDMLRNAAGAVDTAKRSQIYKMRGKGEVVPASIRCYGRNKNDKPIADIIGNTIDRSMSRVDVWPHASNTNRAVTVTASGVLHGKEMSPEELCAL